MIEKNRITTRSNRLRRCCHAARGSSQAFLWGSEPRAVIRTAKQSSKIKLSKRKLTKKEDKKERQLKFMTIFINGKQVRVKRPPTIDELSVDEFIQRNADPIWLAQNEEWENIPGF